MASVIVTIGREINRADYEGTRVGKSRGVWQLHEEDWQAFRERVLHTLTQYGQVVFAGKGFGVNPYDKDSQEESACFVMVPKQRGMHYSDTIMMRAELARMGREYGQLEVGYTVGEYNGILTGE